MNTLFVIGIFLCFFLAFLLLTKRNKTLPENILTLWILFGGVHIIGYYCSANGLWQHFPNCFFLVHPFPLFHGPFLYLYVVYSLRETQDYKWKDLIHFVPIAVFYAYMLFIIVSYSYQEKSLLASGQGSGNVLLLYASFIGFTLSGVTYSILAFLLTKRHDKMVHDNYSFDNNISLNWLRYCVIGIFVIFFFAGAATLLKYIVKINLHFNPDIVYFITTILFVFFFGVFGIQQEGIFSDLRKNPQNNDGEDENNQTAEYKRSGLKAEDAEEQLQKLLDVMSEKKLYLEPKLTLNALSDELDISNNHLSQLINQYQGENFYDFVNRYRVEEFKARVLSPEYSHLNILAVAFDSGFNSKSSFNSVFKSQTGITPSQFLSQNKE